MAALNVAAGAAFWLCAAALLVLAVLSWFAARLLNRILSIPMPYWMRSILLLPRGPCSPQHLERLLEPLSGERVLEIGPGIGIHALPVASRLLPEGVLDAFDAQQEMLDELGRRAEKAATTNIVMVRGDAQVLPYADSTFDAAYLIGTLGEIHDRVGALREARRVLKASGRLVVGEVIIDPDYVQMSVLRAEAETAGFVLVRSTGPRFCYLALFRPRAFLPAASASRRP